MEKPLVILTKIEGAVATIAYSGVALLLIVDIVGREAFGISILGIKTVSIYVAIVAGFLGLVLATSANSHLRPEVFDQIIRGPLKLVTDRISDAVSAILYLVLTWFAFVFVGESIELQDKAPVLYFVLWPIQLVIPYAFLSSSLRHIAFAIRPDLRHKLAP